ncbi:hypothetical protein Syun_030791 [Stephania yunnanensis]|uniref:Uncharacterized protein n=1 Tax=Stephania yunnanensis TaxID=152371 RepID=A0AAP0DZC6_9MAGN
MSPLQHPPPHRNPQIPRRRPNPFVLSHHRNPQIPRRRPNPFVVSPLYSRLSELREPPPPSIDASPHRQPSPFLESSQTLAIATPIHRLHTELRKPAAAERRSLKRSIRRGRRRRS